MSQAPTKPSRTCPSCQAPYSSTARICPKCKLEVAKMPAFAAAQRAALTRGIKTTKVESAPASRFSTAAIVKGSVYTLLFALCVWLGFHYFGPKPPRYLQFPATANDATQALLNHIAAGTDPEFDKAYFLIADSARNTRASDERGDYLQIFDVMNNYLTGEFGDTWASQAKIAPDPADPNTMIVKVALETLHIHVAQQSPPDKLAAYGPHFGITGIYEFDTSQAFEFRKMAGIEGVVGGIAGQGAVNNLETILGANANNRHQPPMVKKVNLLAENRNPHSTTWRSVLQMYPIRQDPVVHGRLMTIVNDERYDLAPRQKAKDILEDKVTEEDLAAIGL